MNGHQNVPEDSRLSEAGSSWNEPHRYVATPLKVSINETPRLPKGDPGNSNGADGRELGAVGDCWKASDPMTMSGSVTDSGGSCA